MAAAAGAVRSPGAEARLLAAVTELCARDSYPALTVERLRAAAAVSRATFYQYFSDVEDCFLSAQRAHSVELAREVAHVDARDPRDPRELAALDALVEFVIRRPQVALLLSRESLAAGPAALREREALIAALGRLTRATPPSAAAVDLPSRILFGGVLRFLSMQIASGPVTPALVDEIRQWSLSFKRSSALCRSEELLPRFPETAGRAPPRPPSTPRSRPARERLLRATAAAILVHGYRAMTVADIVAGAGVSRRLFYRHFTSKREAFIACYETAFTQTVAASAPAYFSPGAWPQRVWDAARAFTGFFAAEPAFAHLGFVECYALGSSFLSRVHDTQLAFTLFLEDGYRQRPHTTLPRSFSALTAATIFEAGFLACRGGASLYMRRIQPLVVYIALAPFIGSEQAQSFLEGKLRAGNAVTSRR
ncbi:MAG TPA: TetR/AcrR family transcriptional regulator [Solirubrobacteraceae bacterium]|nr:TetR/AcrR family transcriptional regulator [Solirubrobacteraceae bacterium]